jgi:hypothetical protein
VRLLKDLARARKPTKHLLKDVRRLVGLSPMQRLLRRLRRHGIEPDHLRALELFGYTGELHTRDYANSVASLEVWEIDQACEEALRRNLPTAEIKITDSFAELRRSTGTYDFVVVDNPTALWGGGHCEHFDIMPRVFRILADQAVLVVTVIPQIGRRQARRAPYLLDPEYLAVRRAFYRTKEPLNVPRSKMATAYRKLCEGNGFEVEDISLVRRNGTLSYLVLQLVRAAPHEPEPTG